MPPWSRISINQDGKINKIFINQSSSTYYKDFQNRLFRKKLNDLKTRYILSDKVMKKVVHVIIKENVNQEKIIIVKNNLHKYNL